MLPANSDAREWRDSSGGGTAVTLNALLADPDLSKDLVCLVERVCTERTALGGCFRGCSYGLAAARPCRLGEGVRAARCEWD
jgi:hypothetical protein